MKVPEVKLWLQDKVIKAGPWIADRVKLDPRGQLAVDIARSLALAAVPAGESSTGEQLYRLMTVEEITNKSIAVSGQIYDKVEEHGWLIELPSIEEMEAFSDASVPPGFRSATGG